MHLALMQHSINWWNNGGHMNVSHLQKVLEAKANLDLRFKTKEVVGGGSSSIRRVYK